MAALAAGLTDHLASVLERLWANLFPLRCLGCGSRGHQICARCEPLIPWLGSEVCPRCARRSALGRLCGRCRARPTSLDGIRAACAFEGLARKGVHELKYRFSRARAAALADLLARHLERRPLRPDLLVPVPLAEGRRRERGFNQAELLARELAALTGLRVAPDVLRRERETPAQVDLAAARRRTNVAGAFVCLRPDEVEGRFVVVVDDVATTGATLTACADALKEAGARRVVGLVVAREL